MTARDTVTRILITARDEASSVFTSLQAKVAGVAVAITGYFGAKLFGDAVSSAREFESAMSRVEAASGATGAELDALKQAAEQAGATTQYTSVEAAAALENLAKAGLSASDAVQTLPAVLDLATAGGVELATASDYITKAVAGMGLSFAEAGRVADVLSMGANASNTSVDGLAQALSYAAPMANTLGLSLEQTVAIIGKFADAGIDASRAGTALNSILAQFSDPASKFRRELADAGITTGDFDQALRQLAAAGPAGQKAILAVGQEAGPALRSLLNQGIDSLDGLKAKLDESAGSARQFADVMSNNLDAATQGLGSAWEAFKIQLGTPVLDTLREQVNALANRLREFVSNGTATAFGEAFRTAFESAGKWVQDFVGRLDFEQVAASMQSFAARVGEIFTDIGENARTAGNVVQTAYGVMVAGVNTVMGAIYKIAEAFSGVVSNVLSGVALLNEGLAKITFGNVSESFRQMAEDIRTHAGAMWAVSEEFAQRASASFEAAADGAEIAQRGYAALSEAVTDNARAIDIANKSVTVTAQQATLTADALDALGEGYEYVDGEARKAATAIDATAQAGSDSVPALDSAASSAEDVAAAYERLGVTSTAALQQAAANARRDFETIRNSGTASAQDIEAAFAAYAEAAIEANGGVVDASTKAQAAQLGLKVEVDDAGKVIVRSMKEAAEAVKEVEETSKDAADASEDMADASEDVADGLNKAADASNSAATASRGVSTAWVDAAKAGSQYADEAGRYAQATYEAQMSMVRGEQTVWSYTRALSAAMEAGKNAAAGYIGAMENLDRQQAALNNSALDGYRDMELQLLRLTGTREQIAAAEKARDEAAIQRQIALAKIEAQRASMRGEGDEARRLQEEIKLYEKQLVLLDKIYREQEKQARAAEKEAKRREQEAEREAARREKEQRAAEKERERERSPESSGPAATPGPARTVNMEITIAGRQHTLQGLPEQSAGTLETMLRDLERAAGVAQ